MADTMQGWLAAIFQTPSRIKPKVKALAASPPRAHVERVLKRTLRRKLPPPPLDFGLGRREREGTRSNVSAASRPPSLDFFRPVLRGGGQAGLTRELDRALPRSPLPAAPSRAGSATSAESLSCQAPSIHSGSSPSDGATPTVAPPEVFRIATASLVTPIAQRSSSLATPVVLRAFAPGQNQGLSPCVGSTDVRISHCFVGDHATALADTSLATRPGTADESPGGSPVAGCHKALLATGESIMDHISRLQAKVESTVAKAAHDRGEFEATNRLLSSMWATLEDRIKREIDRLHDKHEKAVDEYKADVTAMRATIMELQDRIAELETRNGVLAAESRYLEDLKEAVARLETENDLLAAENRGYKDQKKRTKARPSIPERINVV